jgi:hypothetical protein
MADIVLQRNIGALGDIKRLTDHSTATAGGTGAATTVTGNTVDREGFGTGSLPMSALVSVAYEATLQSGATLSLAIDVQNAPDGATWADYQTVAATVVATGPSGGGTVKGEYNTQVLLSSAQRYIRFNYQPTFSSTGTDTFYADGVGFFAGFDRLASTNA